MPESVDVVVAVPARDEEQRIGPCLRSVVAAIGAARRAGVVDRAAVVVGSHRSVDATATTARTLLGHMPGVDGLVLLDDESASVGGVRSRAVAAALGALTGLTGSTPERTWVFSTDADSCVPTDWITATLEQTDAAHAAAAAGLVELDAWSADDTARRAYDQILADGVGPDGHTHVYGANLAVRLDAYLDVGGFQDVRHGEDHALVRRLRHAGWPVLTTSRPPVRTSARMPGRAAHGLGDLLHSLASSRRVPQA